MEQDPVQTLADEPSGTGAWAVRVAPEHAAALAPLRLLRDVEAAVAPDGSIWLRSSSADEMVDRALRRLAPAARYAVTSGDELVPVGHLLPTGRLPRLDWLPLARLITPSPPAAALPARLESSVTLRIVRSTRSRPATHLLARLTDWANYAQGASAVRLKPLRFAATRAEVLIAGTPLPPLPGTPCWEEAGIVVPCGWAWEPTVDAATLRRALQLRTGEVALFRPDGSWELMDDRCFAPARRSAVRETAKAVADE